MNSVVRRTFAFLAVCAFALTGAVAGDVAAQEEEGFPLVAFTAICPLGDFAGPFVDCTPWEGVVVTFADAYDPGWTRTCETVAGDRAASCSLNVPFGSTIVASIMPSSIPEGYALQGELAQEFLIPDGPPEGLFGGPSFVLQPIEEAPVEEDPGMDAGFPLGAAAAYCEPGYLGPFQGCTPWEGLTVTFLSADGAFSTSCVTSGSDRAAGCGVEVPFGSTIIASINPALIPAGYVLEGPVEQVFEIPDGPPEGLFGGPTYVLFAREAEVTEPAEERDDGDTGDDVAAVVSLPSTGTGVTAASGAAMAGMLMGGAAILAAGACGLRRASR